MKSGEEIHFVAGQLFTIGVAIVATGPRMPSDDSQKWTVGGKLSHPFRKALLHLVAIGLIRLVCFHHILFPYLDLEQQDNQIWNVLDAILGIIHVVGQSFLCLTTAYLLQSQLSNVINIGGRPGSNLMPYLVVLAILSLGGALGASFYPKLWSLINLAEAVSCLPVLQTLRLYNTIAVSNQHQQANLLRGPVLTQLLIIEEIWYFVTSVISFVGEALVQTEDSFLGRPLQLLLMAVQHNQGKCEKHTLDCSCQFIADTQSLHSLTDNSVDKTSDRQRGRRLVETFNSLRILERFG
mmetsp:Transcript_7006/g.19632  ORF Transcript_7006/g.19632 Transcript_7006/m.19632 type:complete len:295 (+) Transcript_7006:97-981(+)